MYKKVSTPWSWHKDLFEFAKKIKIEIFSSPFDESAVDFLEKLKKPFSNFLSESEAQVFGRHIW